VTDCARCSDFGAEGKTRPGPAAENPALNAVAPEPTALPPAPHRPGSAMSATSPDGQFEKTFRLVCRLDDADIDYVRDTAEWIRRCVARVLELDPDATATEITPRIVDMSTRGRWRLMRPEIVGEQLASPPHGR
jgi:hypothetical protein